MERNKLIHIVLLTFVLGCVLTFLVVVALNQETNCYENHATLHSQWLDTSHYLCNGCLLFNVTECEKGNYGIYNRNCIDHYLYFEGESALRSDLTDNITVRWCYVPAANDYRVRGVWNT